MFKEVRHGSSLVRLIGLIPDELPAADRTARSPCGLLVQPRGHFAIGTSGGGVAHVNVYDSQTKPFRDPERLRRSIHHRWVGRHGRSQWGRIEDIVVAGGRGGEPIVNVYDGRTLKELGSFDANSATFTGGVNVAVSDVSGGGRADIIIRVSERHMSPPDRIVRYFFC